MVDPDRDAEIPIATVTLGPRGGLEARQHGAHGASWSHGTAYRADAVDEVVASAAARSRPWAASTKPFAVRIVASAISGRRVKTCARPGCGPAGEGSFGPRSAIGNG
jgi:hypothetical protein